MDGKSFLYLFGAVIILIIMILIATSGGINAKTMAIYDEEKKNCESAKELFDKQKTEVVSALEDHPILFENVKVNWEERLKQAEAEITKATENISEAETLVDTEDDEQKTNIENYCFGSRKLCTSSLAAINDMATYATKMVDFKKNRKEKVAKAKKEYEAAKNHDFSAIEVKVNKAKTDWPKKATDLDGRLSKIKNVVGVESEVHYKNLLKENAKSEGAIDFPALLLSSNALINVRKDLDSRIQTLSGLVDQLYWSWDIILEDLDYEESDPPHYKKKIKKVKVKVADKETKSTEKDLTQKEERWLQVSQAEYKKLEKNMGMTLENKPAGKYDFESTKVAQPAGYAYIAEPGKDYRGRNRYGYWGTRGGRHHWVFYPHYGFMGSMYWGPGYYHRPIYSTYYSGYRRAYSSGRTYYGRSSTGGRRYGSGGSYTKTRYSNSNYVKKKTFNKSGGTYSGSKYSSSAKKPSSSSSRYGSKGYGSSKYSSSGSRSSSSRYGGSSYRSSNYRSSGYRSSSSGGSRSFGGK